MSDLTPTTPEPFDGEDLSAGEYALGVLDAHERRAAEARLTAEPAFAREVEAWEARLYPMAEAVAPVAPSAAVWPRILRALGTDAKVVDLAQRRAVKFWRNWALAATAAAAVALVFLAVRPVTQSPAPTPAAPAAPSLLVASLTDKQGRGFLTVTYDPARGELHAIPSLTLPVGAARAAELWLIAADGVPRSLGVIDTTKPTVVKVSDALRPGAKATATLAVTSEQPGGSPTGKPTGAPKWAGKLATT